MKLHILLTSLIFNICNLNTFFNYTCIEKIYFLLFCSNIFIFNIKNKKIILLIHLIYSLLFVTFSLNCNHDLILYLGIISVLLWKISNSIYNSCIFYDLQLPKKLQKKGLYFFKTNKMYITIEKIAKYNLLLALYKIYYKKTLPNRIKILNQIITIIYILILLHDYYNIVKYTKTKNKKNKKSLFIIKPSVCDYT